MEFTKHQYEIWNGMLNVITAFKNGELKFYDFVGSLEGALDAGEFKDESMIKQWYDYWTPLEILRALKGDDVKLSDVEDYICDLDSFIRSLI